MKQHATFRPGSLANSLLWSTARIVTQNGNVTASGTGFVYLHPQPDQPNADYGVPFLVTNRHVVAGAENGRVTFLVAADKQRRQAFAGTPYGINLGDFSQLWFYHPDDSVDLAMMDLSVYLRMIQESHGVRLFTRASTLRDIPRDDDSQWIDAIEDIFMIGYPNAIMDEVNHLPIVRRGITATPFRSNYQGREEFLIDASVFPGSSGSPVFLLDHAKPDTDPSKRLYLLGILSGGFFRVQGSHNTVRGDIPTSIGVSEYHEMLDLGVVVKSRRLFDIIPLWEEHVASLAESCRRDADADRQAAAKLSDADINRLVFELQKAFNVSSWQAVAEMLHSTFAAHLLKKFKTSGLDAAERLLLYRLLQDRPELTKDAAPT
jgi:Trypsin-like peptidase domain